MTSNFSLNKLRHAMGSGGAAPAPAPEAKTSKPSRQSTAFAGPGGLQGRDGGAQRGGMAPRSMNALRGRTPMGQAFSNAAQHARDATQHLSQGMRHEVKQYKNGFSALRAESHEASRPGFGYGAVAQRHRTAQTDHQMRSQKAYANAAGSARGFFGETARGVSQGARQAARSVARDLERFDPRRLAHKVSRYGSAALHKMGQVAMMGVGGAMLAGGAVAYGVNAGRYKVQNMAHAAAQGVNHALHHMDQAIQSAAYGAGYMAQNAINHVTYPIQAAAHQASYMAQNAINHVTYPIQAAAHQASYMAQNAINHVTYPIQAAAYQVGQMAQNAINHVAYPIHAAAHTYQSLAHAASVFKHDMAHFNPHGMHHNYQQYHARPQWY
ncbi:hypothetical protein [Acidovorax sp. SUPP3334]|uniref:hypothetical protein n=1 Tax=Acidovorax sp. SUPP3334 TaxID=2920881 RepID=UPI0023DE1A59|nr:hypothetical protein [Acidovorax sp. SUPP3334]GKT25638.1 hypothetical protein AVHM3334_18575 [Acidovorax sp. SUPP3334]